MTSHYQHPRRSRDKLMHIEAAGVTVEIDVSHTDEAGRWVTRVDVTAQDERRGGDKDGNNWVQDGARFVRLLPGESPDAINRQAIETAARDLLALLDRVVPSTTAHWAVEENRQHLAELAFHAKNIKLSASADAQAEPTGD